MWVNFNNFWIFYLNYTFLNVKNVISIFYYLPVFNSYIFIIGVIFGFFIFIISYFRFNFIFRFIKYFFFFFFIAVIVLITTNNMFIFFFAYECLFLPSFLLVYYISPNRRAIFASLYFFFWTQLGSLLVLVGLLGIYFCSTLICFSDLYLLTNYLDSFEVYLYTVFIFLGFGVKLPIWPFYYWLTKTHVEAPTFFSIYLSGFLVKTALFGFYLFYSYVPFSSGFFGFFGLVSFGIIDSTMKMFGQVDLKKLVAYGTVQEMNLIALLLLIGGVKVVNLVILFCLTHTLLSSLFFYIVDVLYRLYRSRSNQVLSGLGIINPTLSFIIILSVLLYTGIPFTLKFVVEFYLFVSCLNVSVYMYLIILLVIQWLGGVFWCFNWFSILYGQPSLNLSPISSLKRLDYFFFIIIISSLLSGILLVV